jgi:hypothetical protein
MADFLKMTENRDTSSLGTSLTSWVYRSKRSSSFFGYAVGLLAAAVIFMFMYGRHLVPLLKRIPDGAVYVFIFIVGPALKVLKSLGKDRQYTLYENGFTVLILNKGAAAGENKVGYWIDYAGCSYDSHSVTLFSDGAIKRKIRLLVNSNVPAVYSICREHISLAQAKKLHASNPAPSTPNTPEQRRLKSFEKQSQWKRSYPSDRKQAWRV